MSVDGRTELLVVHHAADPQPAAAAALTIGANGMAIQTWGAVRDPYRGRNLSRCMQDSALARCRDLGVATAVTVTRNVRVARPHRQQVDLWIYRSTGGRAGR